LEAFTELLKGLPLDTGMGFVLVQHLDPQHESALTQLLTRATSMPVCEATQNLRVEANHVYIIPPNTNLSIALGVLKLQPRQETGGGHRSIDFFFESLAQDHRELAIGVILSGTATDGTLGLEAIKAEGGITFAQDDSAKYDSMPRSAVAAGCVDFVLKPEEIAKELARIEKHPYVAAQTRESGSPKDIRASAKTHEDDESPLPSGGERIRRTGARQARAEAQATRSKVRENVFKKILLLLRNHCGVDFSLYKSSTIQRRITRRMVLNKNETVEHYADFLKGNTHELNALYADCLISVTSFFRNPEAFEVLKSKVFPKLFQQRSDDPVRVWVLGCSTGQEAYSIAMAFVESMEKAPRKRKLQVFATDLNEALLDKARHGLYAKKPRSGCITGTVAALFCRGARRLSCDQVAARDGRLRPAEPHQRPALLAPGSHQLPKSPHLSGSEFAEEGAGHVPLRAQTGGSFVVRCVGIHRPFHRFV
jgi:two-component system CheB/CheR fusion protein